MTTAKDVLVGCLVCGAPREKAHNSERWAPEVGPEPWRRPAQPRSKKASASWKFLGTGTC